MFYYQLSCKGRLNGVSANQTLVFRRQLPNCKMHRFLSILAMNLVHLVHYNLVQHLNWIFKLCAKLYRLGILPQNVWIFRNVIYYVVYLFEISKLAMKIYCNHFPMFYYIKYFVYFYIFFYNIKTSIVFLSHALHSTAINKHFYAVNIQP